jgi:hypothetical protein
MCDLFLIKLFRNKKLHVYSIFAVSSVLKHVPIYQQDKTDDVELAKSNIKIHIFVLPAGCHSPTMWENRVQVECSKAASYKGPSVVS